MELTKNEIKFFANRQKHNNKPITFVNPDEWNDWEFNFLIFHPRGFFAVAADNAGEAFDKFIDWASETKERDDDFLFDDCSFEELDDAEKIDYIRGGNDHRALNEFTLDLALEIIK